MEDLSPDTVAVQIIDFSAELEGEKKVKSKINLNVLLLLSLKKEMSCRLPVVLSQDRGCCCLQIQHYLHWHTHVLRGMYALFFSSL